MINDHQDTPQKGKNRKTCGQELAKQNSLTFD